ncbi:MAG: DUF4249 domain-containing protein [Bacteroidales bacterium]|nr:DUF4249 domain-containing protein [Bacteroidales bacterium]
MMTKIKQIILLLILIVSNSCIEKYTPELEKYENLLVIDGMITNETGPYTIQLSTSSELYLPKNIPHTGAKITLSDNQGNTDILTEIEDGKYISSESGIQGVVGRKYKIEIITREGTSFESGFEELKVPSNIKQVYAEIETKQLINEPQLLEGYQFYIDTEKSMSPDNYYLWKLYETYKFNSDFKIYYVFEGRLKPVYNTDTLYTCWKTNDIKDIFTYSTSGLDQTGISNIPLNYVSTNTKRLTQKYSLLTEQLTITKQAFDYWSSLKKQNSDQGNLYAQQPYQIKGNIKNTENPDEPVLGYFMAASVVKNRIFVDPPEGVFFHLGECTPDDDIMMVLYSTPASDWPIYLTMMPGGGIAYAAQSCLDCTNTGGELDKPDFWPEENQSYNKY